MATPCHVVARVCRCLHHAVPVVEVLLHACGAAFKLC